MRGKKQEMTHNARLGATPMTGCWRTFGILCLILAATAMVSPAQDEQQDEQPSTDSVKFTTLPNFDGTNGGNPAGSLVQGLDGNLYGTTFPAGANTSGTFFRISPTGTLTTLYNFCAETNCADGDYPAGALVLGTDGNFYGITLLGGANGHNAGTAFKITPSGTLTTLYNWCSQANCADGGYGFWPQPGPPFVQATDGNFYGRNDDGGILGAGTVFKLTPTGLLTTLYSFCSQSGCTDGYDPMGLIQATDGDFYGTTYSGGSRIGEGTVFKITPGGTLTTLYNFCSQTNCTDGAIPFGGLIQATDGNLYGSTTYGGANVDSASCVAEGRYFCGTIFKITPSGTLTTVYNFCSQTNCTDGASPQFGLVQATDGNFYGSTATGGINTCTSWYYGTPGCGTAFRLAPGGALTTLHSFDSTDGDYPDGVFQGTNGTFYGTTLVGGTYVCGFPCGTVFSLAVGLGPFVETLPTRGKVGAPIKILGTNLTGATSVTFNGTPAAFKVVPHSLISATVPEGATSGKVEVSINNLTLSSNVRFQVGP